VAGVAGFEVCSDPFQLLLWYVLVITVEVAPPGGSGLRSWGGEGNDIGYMVVSARTFDEQLSEGNETKDVRHEHRVDIAV
jgi:hypothetical protein